LPLALRCADCIRHRGAARTHRLWSTGGGIMEGLVLHFRAQFRSEPMMDVFTSSAHDQNTDCARDFDKSRSSCVRAMGLKSGENSYFRRRNSQAANYSGS
jgi:hypothetical protein